MTIYDVLGERDGNCHKNVDDSRDLFFAFPSRRPLLVLAEHFLIGGDLNRGNDILRVTRDDGATFSRIWVSESENSWSVALIEIGNEKSAQNCLDKVFPNPGRPDPNPGTSRPLPV